MIRLTGTLTCRTETEAERVRAALPEHIRLTRAEPGCLSFEVTATENPLVWQVSETFTTREAFDAHQARTRASDWAHESAGIPRAYSIEEG